MVSASGFGYKEARILEEVSADIFYHIATRNCRIQYMEAIKDDSPEEIGESDEESDEEDVDDNEDQDGGLPVEPELAENHDSATEGTTKEAPEHRNSSDVDDLSPSRLARELSRSPPQSRSPSPSSLAKMTAALSLSSSQHSGIKDIVSSDLTKQRARQRQKYHSKRGAHRVGRPKGSKAKQDSRVKVDKSGVWE